MSEPTHIHKMYCFLLRDSQVVRLSVPTVVSFLSGAFTSVGEALTGLALEWFASAVIASVPIRHPIVGGTYRLERILFY